MKLVEIIRQESSVSFKRLLSLAVFSGLTQAAVLAIINTASSSAAPDSGVDWRLLSLFSGTLVVHIVSKKYVMQTSTNLVEGVLNRMRLRISDKIRLSELQAFEKIGRARIYSNVTKETIRISEAAPTMVISGQSAIMVCFALMYLAWLAPAVFAVTVALVIVGASIHLRRTRARHADMQRALDRENEFFDLLIHLLDGFKEVKMSTSRSMDLMAHMQGIAADLMQMKVKYSQVFAVNFIFSQAAFYVIMGVVVFFLPSMATMGHEVTMKATAAILFIITPLSDFIGSIPAFANANIAAENICSLEEELDRGHETQMAVFQSEALQPVRPTLLWDTRIDAIKKIEFKNVKFHYFDKDGHPTFTLGPMNLTVRAGETVFIVGGNGSGKSTFLKLLTALYPPMGGTIKVDSVDVQELHHPTYRNHFAVIFSDYHLFDRLYGLTGLDPDRVQELLEVMGISELTEWVDDRFTNLDLSTGQRKRLALLGSFLEDRQIYVFDEWAADQDPGFRRYFYEVLLKDLKAKGKTIIAVTHDEKYFGVADRVIKMEYGRLEPGLVKKTRSARAKSTGSGKGAGSSKRTGSGKTTRRLKKPGD